MVVFDMTSFLVTGGAGFIGSHVCEALLSRNDSVICVDNFNDYYDPKIKERNISNCLKNNRFKLYRIDITDSDALKKIFEENKVDCIIHLAARAGVRPSLDKPELYYNVNVNGTKNLLELAAEFKIKKIVYASSSSVYGTNKKMPFSEEDVVESQVSPYAKSKREAELLCKSYHEHKGIAVLCLRFFTVYGPRGRPDMAPFKFTKLISEGKPIEVYGDGSSERDYTYITDIVKGVTAATDSAIDFEIINLGNANPTKLSDFISIIEDAVGKKAIIKRLPEQQGDVPATFADISKARKLLGYNPIIEIEDGLKKFVDWYNTK